MCPKDKTTPSCEGGQEATEVQEPLNNGAATKSKSTKTNVEDSEEESNTKHLPIDRGWAWVVSFACLMNIALLVGYLICNGILFIEFLDMFQASATSTTLIFGFTSVIFSLSSFITMQVLIPRFSIRQILSCGAILVSLGIFASMFAQNIAMLIAALSLLTGTGQAMIMGPNFVAVSRYFSKRRALAMSITSSGVSMATVLFPMLCRFLLDTYGLKGTLLIFAGIELNIIVFSMLIMPLTLPTDIKPKAPQRCATPLIQKAALGNGTDIELIQRLNSFSSQATDDKRSVSSRNYLRQISAQSVRENGVHVHIPLIGDEEYAEQSMAESNIRNRRPELLSVPSFMGSLASIPTMEPQIEEIQEVAKTNIFIDLKNVIKSLDFSLWRNFRFIFILLTSIFGAPAYIYVVYLPAILTEFGDDPADIPNFLNVIGCVDFVSRLFFGYLADTKKVKLKTIMFCGIIVAGTNCHLMRFYRTYTSQYVCVTIFGIVSNIYGTFLIVYITDLLGIANLPNAVGFLQIIHGAMISTVHPIIGVLRDATGSYIMSYHYLGSISILSGIIMLMEPVFIRLEARRINRQNEVKNNKP